MYTSLKLDMFQAIDEMMCRFTIKNIDGWTPLFISQTDQLLMTFIKTTTNTPLLDLAERFHTSASSVHNIVTSQICAMHEVLYESLIEMAFQLCKNAKALCLLVLAISVHVALCLMPLKLHRMFLVMT